MMIIGCDFHPSWQQIAWLDSETGETGEQKLVHARGEGKQFYQHLVQSLRSYRGAPGCPRREGGLVDDVLFLPGASIPSWR
jgi:hypothetical protein